MKKSLSRRDLIVAATGAVIAMPNITLAAEADFQDRKPPLPPELVKEFVGAAHSNFDKVKEMLAAHPTLLNATTDHQNGDFEAAIGGAGHMGRRDIAEFLIAQGARTDLFVHAMLGHLDIVKPILTRHPEMINCKGPHGISLMRHAEMGKEGAKEVLDFLKSIQKVAE